MTYDPLPRGPHPVGVRTVELADTSRDRRLIAEVWYPAAAAHAGADLAADTRDRYLLMPGFPEPWQAAVRDATPADGGPSTRSSLRTGFPLTVFSHGFAGHRRQSTFLCTHLASHGWVVASVDHAGNTFADLFARRGQSMSEAWQSSMTARPGDVGFVIDSAAAGALGAPAVDTSRVAMTGHSFGGWTALRVVADEPRIAAVVALAPAAGVPVLRAALDLSWTRLVPTAIVAAERDSLLPLAPLEEVFDELSSPALMVTVENTDHMHFCDGARETHEMFRTLPLRIVPLATPMAPFAELAPARHGHDSATAVGLAHLDAHLRDRADARAWLDDVAARLGEREIATRVRRR